MTTYERVPFRWRVGTNEYGSSTLVCTCGGGPSSPQPWRTWEVTLGPAEFRYDDEAIRTLVAMVELWPVLLAVAQRLLNGWCIDGQDVEAYPELWVKPNMRHEHITDLERRVLNLLEERDE